MLSNPDVFGLRSSGSDGLTAVQGCGRKPGCHRSRKEAKSTSASLHAGGERTERSAAPGGGRWQLGGLLS